MSTENNPQELFFWMAEKWREMTDHPIYERIPVEDVTNESDYKFPIFIEEIYVPNCADSIEEESKSTSLE